MWNLGGVSLGGLEGCWPIVGFVNGRWDGICRGFESSSLVDGEVFLVRFSSCLSFCFESSL